MQFTMRSILLASGLLFATGSVAKPFHMLAPRADSKFVGCYSSSDGLGSATSYEFQSSGWCTNKCSDSAAFGLTGGSDCLCGNLIPPSSDKVDTSKCDTNCDGWPEDKCGGKGYYSVYTLKDNVGTYSSSSSSNSSSTNNSTATATSTGAVVSTNSGGQTVTMTAASEAQNVDPTQTAQEQKKKDSHNTAAIAAGVVVGVVGVAALAGALFFFFRSRQQKAQGSRLGGGNGRSSMPAMGDSRFDGQFMAQRRQSNGSIDDDHDFSRRILQVTNPDR